MKEEWPGGSYASTNGENLWADCNDSWKNDPDRPWASLVVALFGAAAVWIAYNLWSGQISW